MKKPIIVTGYPYAYPYYFKVFEYAENKDDLILILPKRWKAKNGKIKIDLKKDSNFKTYGLSACSYGGKSLFGGLFKGWMPAICVVLFYARLKYSSRVLYSCSEPNLLTTLYSGFFAKLLGYKYVLFTWQNVPPKKRMSGLKLLLSNVLVKLNLAFADGIICGNQKAADIVKKFKILISPLSGVDTEKFRPGIASNWREKLGIKNDEKLILFYGALEKRKGVDTLIEAFNILNSKFNPSSTESRRDREILNSKLVIVGTGPEKKNLESRILNFELAYRTVFLDWMANDELPALVNAADVFVYPSVPFGGWEEQFGYAMAEASACKIPVVATKTGSIDEVVVDGKSGLLVESNNPEQLAEAINKVLSSPELAKQMGEFGRDYIVRNFSHEVVVKKLISFLDQF